MLRNSVHWLRMCIYYCLKDISLLEGSLNYQAAQASKENLPKALCLSGIAIKWSKASQLLLQHFHSIENSSLRSLRKQQVSSLGSDVQFRDYFRLQKGRRFSRRAGCAEQTDYKDVTDNYTWTNRPHSRLKQTESSFGAKVTGSVFQENESCRAGVMQEASSKSARTWYFEMRPGYE